MNFNPSDAVNFIRILDMDSKGIKLLETNLFKLSYSEIFLKALLSAAIDGLEKANISF